MLDLELMVCIMCLVSLLLLSWAILLYTRVKTLETEVDALKHYIRTKKKFDVGIDIEHPSNNN